MQTRSEIEANLLSRLQDYPDILARYRSGDPLVGANLKAIAGFLSDFSYDLNVSLSEPFTKSKPTTIIADAVNKGILPVGLPCQHVLTVKNTGTNSVSLSQGRKIQDSYGREWRLLASSTIAANASSEVTIEQSTFRQVNYQAGVSENFHNYELAITDDLHLAAIGVHDLSSTYAYKPRWMNVAAGEKAFNLKADSMDRIYIEFGDSERCGVTLDAAEQITFDVLETYGQIEINTLDSASLQVVNNVDEQKIKLRFKVGGLIRGGANPLSLSELALLASYPTYDENAVLLSNFDFVVRKKFMARSQYLAVWNEVIHEKYYGANISNINKLNFCVVAKNSSEQALLESEITAYLGKVDTLYSGGNTRAFAANLRPFTLTINAQLAPVHDIDGVKSQIKSLLVEKFGQGTVPSSYFRADGFNGQEIAKLLRENIVAFQDRISDFSLIQQDTTSNPIKPSDWLYLTSTSVVVNVQITANQGAGVWTLSI